MKIRTVREYLPLLIVPAVAVVINLGLAKFDQEWSLSDWATNVVLGLAITIVGGMLASRQQKIQEALADLEMTEKIAVFSGEASAIKRKGRSGSELFCQAFLDARAGLSLLGLARPAMQREYLVSLKRTMETMEQFAAKTLSAYQAWSPEDWLVFKQVAETLKEDLRLRKRRCASEHRHIMEGLECMVEEFLSLSNPPNVSPQAFCNNYTSGENIIRVNFNWELFLSQANEGSASVEISTFRVTRADEIEHYFTPWYVSSEEHEVPWDDPSGAPLSVVRAAEFSGGVGENRQRRIAQTQDWLASHGQTDGTHTTICVSSIALPSHQRLLLDGNHRMVAAVRLLESGTEIKVQECLVKAPLQELLLPDLRHWVTPG
ncbi:hypothetical protein ACH4SP_25935 [Streptomyces sp. NPDC021093]|uniref:hypothetical protein n=1 Tax=Streptomyces sp. NPDC021093 TaxID=3365112 RepID=UPI00378CFCF2